MIDGNINTKYQLNPPSQDTFPEVVNTCMTTASSQDINGSKKIAMINNFAGVE
jgi:hypothetical protein